MTKKLVTLNIFINAIVFSLLFMASAAQAADTLVVKGDDGSFKPGVATVWVKSGEGLLFTLDAEHDVGEIILFLQDRLAQARIEVLDSKLKISGIPEAVLLDQLSTLSLSNEGAGEGDPLADLAGLGGAEVAMQIPEAGGSIRAAKGSGSSDGGRVLAPHDPKERFTADVLEVKLGEFPHAELKVRVRRSARAGEHKSSFRRGKVLRATVLFAGPMSAFDLSNAYNKRNLIVNYLKRGDRVILHALPTANGKAFEIDFIERR